MFCFVSCFNIFVFKLLLLFHRPTTFNSIFSPPARFKNITAFLLTTQRRRSPSQCIFSLDIVESRAPHRAHVSTSYVILSGSATLPGATEPSMLPTYSNSYPLDATHLLGASYLPRGAAYLLGATYLPT